MLKYDNNDSIFEYNKIFGYILNNNRYNNYIRCKKYSSKYFFISLIFEFK